VSSRARRPCPDQAHAVKADTVKSLDLKHLDDPHATADALTPEGAIDRIDALAADFRCEGSSNAARHPLSKAVGTLLGTPATAPRSGDDALHLAKTVADGLRSTAGLHRDWASPVGRGLRKTQASTCGTIRRFIVRKVSHACS